MLDMGPGVQEQGGERGPVPAESLPLEVVQEQLQEQGLAPGRAATP
jgi:hypothetical protein